MNGNRPATLLELELAASSPLSASQSSWSPGDAPLPAIYLSHGAPPLFDDRQWMRELFDWAYTLPKPKGILIVSAHWEAAPLMLTSAAAGTPLVYDFYGFEQRFYEITYPTPSAEWLVAMVRKMMPDMAPAYEHPSRGLDHGAWVPLKVMYPNADVPVVQMSIPTSDPQGLMRLGERLRPLRDEGVLVVGSGFMTHGLPFLRREHMMPGASPPGWSAEFDAWVAEALDSSDIDTLARFDTAPGMPYAHPTVEHFIPLFVTLGASGTPEVSPTTVIDGYFWGFAKRSFQIP